MSYSLTTLGVEVNSINEFWGVFCDNQEKIVEELNAIIGDYTQFKQWVESFEYCVADYLPETLPADNYATLAEALFRSKKDTLEYNLFFKQHAMKKAKEDEAYGVKFNEDYTKIISANGETYYYDFEYFVPQCVTTIGDSAFSKWRSLSIINIPDSVNFIGAGAFVDCGFLHSITLPNSIKTINDHTFSGCYRLREIAIPNGVTSIGREAFCSCSNLEGVEMPNSITSIGDDAFSDCETLFEIIIPDSVTSIGTAAFCGCLSLNEIIIPNSVTSIGEEAFWNCENLFKLTLPKSLESTLQTAFVRFDLKEIIYT